MNRETWEKLSDLEKWIKVAELCGWKGPFRMGNVHLHGHNPKSVHGVHYAYGEHVPDYLNDLNAMKEAEDALITKQNTGMWMHYLCLACMHAKEHTCRASARSRAEALVLVLEAE